MLMAKIISDFIHLMTLAVVDNIPTPLVGTGFQPVHA